MIIAIIINSYIYIYIYIYMASQVVQEGLPQGEGAGALHQAPALSEHVLSRGLLPGRLAHGLVLNPEVKYEDG